MAKKEKIFPLNTIGGRIQRKRHELNLSRSEFYDLIFENSIEDGSAGSDSSKEKTVYNWESEKTELDYSTILSVCRILKLSLIHISLILFPGVMLYSCFPLRYSRPPTLVPFPLS